MNYYKLVDYINCIFNKNLNWYSFKKIGKIYITDLKYYILNFNKFVKI